jgi:hypothetical protein
MAYSVSRKHAIEEHKKINGLLTAAKGFAPVSGATDHERTLLVHQDQRNVANRNYPETRPEQGFGGCKCQRESP